MGIRWARTQTAIASAGLKTRARVARRRGSLVVRRVLRSEMPGREAMWPAVRRVRALRMSMEIVCRRVVVLTVTGAATSRHVGAVMELALRRVRRMGYPVPCPWRPMAQCLRAVSRAGVREPAVEVPRGRELGGRLSRKGRQWVMVPMAATRANVPNHVVRVRIVALAATIGSREARRPTSRAWASWVAGGVAIGDITSVLGCCDVSPRTRR